MSEIIKKEALLNETDEDTQKDKYLTFSLGREYYGIEIRYVTEIIGIQAITEVPELPVYVKGIINLRGKIIPVMDVRLRFKKEPLDYNDRTCIIVIDIGDICVGLIVDMVSEVISIPEEKIVPPPEINSVQGSFVRGIGQVDNEVKLILDCEKLLNNSDFESISIM